jgi:hypothetical protein
MKNNIHPKKQSALLIIFCAIILFLTIRGLPGNPSAQMINQDKWRDNGPLELSPERGRYALIYSVVEDKSLKFSIDLARFVAPDVGYINNHYTSIFAPTVSFIAIPGYILGSQFGLAQIGAFAVIAVFSLLNFILIRAISIRVGANRIAADIAGIIFLFATPAFAYAVTLYQHHISTFLLLICIYILLKSRSFISLFIVWMLIALSVTVDNPNLFTMMPIGVFTLIRTFSIERLNQSIKIALPLKRTLALLGAALPLIFFLWFNHAAYGNPFQLPGTIQRTTEIDANGKPVLHREKKLSVATKPTGSDATNDAALGFFRNRNITNGIYTFFLSPDRGMIIYTPVILLGFAGFMAAAKKNNQYALLLFSIISINIIIYSMWGDPYGGWAFGSRYLIPGYAMLAIFISLLLTYFNKKILFLAVFSILLIYSITVNTLGAITSNKNPPQTEAVALENLYKIRQPYTYERNINMLHENASKSFIFSTIAKNYTSAWGYSQPLRARSYLLP